MAHLSCPSFARTSVAIGLLFAAACTDSSADPGAVRIGGGDSGSGAGEPTSPAQSTTAAPTASAPGPRCAANAGYHKGQKLTVNGDERTYNLFVPSTAGTRALPVVFVFHGDGGDGDGLRGYYKLEGEAGGGAIFVYPDGANATWDIDTSASSNADYKFFDAMVAAVTKDGCADAKRVFATGYSRGAYFANQLGCWRGGVVRGIAAHEGGGPFGGDGDYDDHGNLACTGKPVAALIAHGTSDDTVRLDEGRKSRDYWRGVDKCKTSTKPFAPSPCVTYDGCAAGQQVVYCEIPGLGHQVWPQGGAKATWAFFSSL